MSLLVCRTLRQASGLRPTAKIQPRSVRAASTAAGPAFDWTDPLASKSILTEDELAIAETAERYSQEQLLPRVLQAYRDEHYDPKILEEMGDLGLLGATIEGYGCAGVSTVAGALITRAVERVDSGYRSGMSVQSSLVMGGIYEHGSQEQKEKHLPLMARGKSIGAFGLTEPNHGSDPGSMETVAKPHPTKTGYFSLSGSKTWITNSPIADVLLVWAKLQSTGKIRGFLVERSVCPPGTLETPAIKNKNGLRASITGMIHLDGCPVPEANMFPEVEGLRGPFSCLNSARYGISLGVMGALEDAIARAREYALERKQFKGNPLAKYQLIQKKLADAATDAAYGTLAAIQVGRLKDQGLATPEMISMIKRRNCDVALSNARVLQEIFGGNAVSDEYMIGRHVANLFVTQTYEGQSDIHSLILGRAITGVQAFA
ncbi:probable glutaryl-CoA dehydrogenase [Cephalotrichum gorgonifer]|uniref:glutaryl-CoA dehydrogenase (ETF) n=1 Tax=Cephalotrichum gorgonifer TaxID=2041049 RepID=A0AAE8N7C3_9PEZI|nr:probable glutaryl-CoA dehydrogenase [Cephalotrichum gorgonifer]